MRQTQVTLATILAFSATATIALAGNNNFKFSQSGRSGNQHSQNGGGGNGSGNGSQAMRSQFSQGSGKKLQGMTLSGNNQFSSGQAFQKFSGASNQFKQKPIDPGFGNGQHGHGHHDDHHNDHHADHHHDDHHGHQHHEHHQSWPWPWVVTQPFPHPVYRYPNYPTHVTTPGLVTERLILPNGALNQGGPRLVEGIDLQVVDARLVDRGDAARKLGPRFRVVVGNRGTRAAGNFQVLAVAAKNKEMSPDSPSTMVEVEGITSGQIAKVDIRLPIEAMTVTDGQPFEFLAVVADVSKLIDETVEEDNAVLMERDKILPIDAK